MHAESSHFMSNPHTPQTLLKLTHKLSPNPNNTQDYFFIKSWSQVHNNSSIHLFYNHNTLNFSALLQGPQGIQFIPTSKDGFNLITAPFLSCKSFRARLSGLQPSKLIEFFRRELRYPILRETAGSLSLQLNIGGLLGGGSSVSMPTKAEQEVPNFPVGSNEYNSVHAFLKNRYALQNEAENLKDNPKDKQQAGNSLLDDLLVDKLSEKICAILPIDQALRLDKYLPETVDSYEEEYLDEVVLEVLTRKIEDGRPALTDYTQNFGSRKLCIELLRKGYFAKERSKGGIELAIADKVLAKLTEHTEPFYSKISEKFLKKETESFEDLLLKLEMKERVLALLKPLSKIKAKKVVESIKKELEIQSDQLSDFDEFNFCYVTQDKYERILKEDLTVVQGPGSTVLPGSMNDLHEQKKDIKQKTKKPSKYLNRIRLNVLSEMNLLDHEPSTLVELHNLLERESVVAGLDKKKYSNSKKLNDIKSLIKSIIIGYKEDESNIEPKELDSLIPLAFVQDKEIFQKFLTAFLEDFRNDIFFNPQKVKILSLILTATLQKGSQDYLKPDDLLSILNILTPKIEGLSITSENVNLQEAVNSLNDVLFLMGFLNTTGVKDSYFTMVKELTKNLQTHGLEKVSNSIMGKGRNPSLEIKREYALEALKRIEGTKFAVWQEKWSKILEAGQMVVDIGKGVFLGDLASISDTLLKIGDMALKAYGDRLKKWYNNANNLRFLKNEPIKKIMKEIFKNNYPFNKSYSFFVAEFLLSVAAQPQRKLREKKMLVQALWFLANGFDYKKSTTRALANSTTYRRNDDICFYAKQALSTFAQNSEGELNMFILKLIETPIKASDLENNKADLRIYRNLDKKANEVDDAGNPYFLKVLMEKKPKLYALAKIQKHSEKTLEKPAILIDFLGIDREKDFDEAFIRKVREKVENIKSKQLLKSYTKLIRDKKDLQAMNKKNFLNIFFNKVHLMRDYKKEKSNEDFIEDDKIDEEDAREEEDYEDEENQEKSLNSITEGAKSDSEDESEQEAEEAAPEPSNVEAVKAENGEQPVKEGEQAAAEPPKEQNEDPNEPKKEAERPIEDQSEIKKLDEEAKENQESQGEQKEAAEEAREDPDEPKKEAERVVENQEEAKKDDEEAKDQEVQKDSQEGVHQRKAANRKKEAEGQDAGKIEEPKKIEEANGNQEEAKKEVEEAKKQEGEAKVVTVKEEPKEQPKKAQPRRRTKRRLLKKKSFKTRAEEEVNNKKQKEKDDEKIRKYRQNLIEQIQSKLPKIIEQNKANLFDTLEEFLLDPTKTVLLIQGDAGTGKTLLLRLIEQKLWSRYHILTKADIKNPNRLPLRITLSEVRSLDKAVDEFLLSYGCTQEEAYEIKKEPAVILFDGYDEINQNINLYDANKLNAWRDVKVIFTSRKENLTSLKEDYILCFAPGKDKSKVLSHSILPISEDQIKKYFSAQTSENELKITKLEKDLEKINGNGILPMPATATLRRKIVYLESFSQSDKFKYLNDILVILKEKIPRIKALELEENRKDIDAKRLELIKIFERRQVQLQSLTDAKKIESFKAELKKNKRTMEQIETEFGKLNKAFGVNGAWEIVRLMQNLRSSTGLKKIAELISDKSTDIEDDIEHFAGEMEGYLGELENVKKTLKRIETKTTQHYFKDLSADLKKKLENLKGFEKQMKPTDSSITNYLQKDIFRLEQMANPRKLSQAIQKLNRFLDDFKKIANSFSWLYQEEHHQEEEKEAADQQPAQNQQQNPQNQAPANPKEALSYEKLKRTIARLQVLLKTIRNANDELSIFDSNYLDTEKLRYSFGSMIYVKGKTKHDSATLEALSKAYESFQALTDELKYFKKPNRKSEVLTADIQEYIEDLLKLLHLKSSQIVLNRLTEHIEKTQQSIKAQGHFEQNKKRNKVHALQDRLKVLEDSEQNDFDPKIQELGEILEEIIEQEKDFEAIKDDNNMEEPLKVKTITEEIKVLKKFTDPRELKTIIGNFKDIVISPFMLKMLLQTLIEFPKSAANKADLYRLFSKIHFEREKDKLLQTEKIPPKFNIIDSFYHYSKDIAVNMFIKKVTSIQAKSHGYRALGIIEARKNNMWSRFFDDDDLITKLSRRGAQIIEDDGVVRFIHKSIMEYFAARQFYDEIAEYNADDQEAYDPCLNKGTIIDNETAVYQFIKDISDSKTKKNKDKNKNKTMIQNNDDDESDEEDEEEDGEKDETMSAEDRKETNEDLNPDHDSNNKEMVILDKKLFEIFGSSALLKEYADDFKQFDRKFFYPNLFLILLLRKELMKKIIEIKEDSPASLIINNLFKWIFSNSEGSKKFIEMIERANIVNTTSGKSFWPLLPIHYHFETRQKGEEKSEGIPTFIERKAQNIKLIPVSKPKGSLIPTKDSIIEKDASVFGWELEAKLFIYGSQDSIVVVRTMSKNQKVKRYLGVDTNEKKDQIPFTLVETDMPWEFKECKWLLRVTKAKKTNFMLRSLADTSVILYGCFKDIKDYKMMFSSMCAADVHAGSVCDDDLYQCVTCNLMDNNVLCKSCVETCHKGHNTPKYKKCGGYCDCRFSGCCQIARGCTSRFGKEFRNDVMFKCTQCPEDKKNTILCMACRNHHESTHQNFEKVTGKHECECDCVSNRTTVLPKKRKVYYDEDDDLDADLNTYEDQNNVYGVSDDDSNDDESGSDEDESESEDESENNNNSDEDESGSENDDSDNEDDEDEDKNSDNMSDDSN